MLDKKLLKYLGNDTNKLYKIVLLHLLNTLTSILSTALLVTILYNSINYNLHKILIYISILVITIILNIIFYSLSSKLKYELGNIVTTKVRNESYSKFINIDDIKYSTSEIAQLSIEGVEQLRSYFTMFIPAFFTSMISPLLLFIIIMFFSPVIALYYLLLVPLIPVSIILVSKWAKKIFNKYWDIYLNLGNSFLDNIRGLKEITNFNQKINKKNSLDKESDLFRKITMKVLVMQLVSVTIMDLVAFGGAGIGIVLTLNEMYNGLNPYITIFIILLGAEFFLPLRALGSAFHIAMNGKTSGTKLLELINTPGCSYDLTIDKIDSVKLDNVTYTFAENILESINLEFNKGLYSIAGVSGSGKSTIAKSIARRNNKYSGDITINGINILRILETNLYNRLVYIDNKTYIFNASIRDNFKMHKESITDDEIYNLLDKVNLTYLYKNNSLDYIINDTMTNISGGERQRLAIAMMLSRSYDLYIFDEVTSNVDHDSELIIMDIIKNISRDKIVILISHRLDNHKCSDFIYYLEDKKVKEMGNFNDIYALKGCFYELYNKQKELEL